MWSSSYCLSCRVPLSGPVPARQHYAGKAHAKAMLRVRAAQLLKQERIIGVNGSLPANSKTASPSSETTHRFRSEQSKNADEPLDQPLSDSDEDSYHGDEYVWNGESGCCYVCNVWFTSSAVAQQHLDGYRHNRALQLSRWMRKHAKASPTPGSSTIDGLQRGSIDSYNLLFCDVCFKRVDTAEQLRLHRQSPAHLKMAARRSWSATISLGGVPGDNTEWETCNVCGKMVNSREQLIIHLRSHHPHILDDLRLHEPTSSTNPEAVGRTKNAADSGSTPASATSRLVRWKAMLSQRHCVGSSSPSERCVSEESKIDRGADRGGDDVVDNSRTITRCPTQDNPSTDLPFGPQYRYYCPLCMVPFDTIQTKLEHERGKQHVTNVSRKMKAPVRNLPDVKMSARAYSSIDVDVKSLTKTEPRPYQIELYEASMKTDSVCFLPTGTGKTLVAAMVLSRMLQLNPHHSAVFLVDKVLLCIQQSTFIWKELGEKIFRRWDHSTQTISDRRLRIAMLCGQKEKLAGLKLWEHDVIVATAGCYSNLIERNALRWTDNCVAVFDEVHHCHDEHPYLKLLQQTRHARLTSGKRPKLLGLTASPAGKETISATVVSLRRLLKDFGCGGTKLIRVSRNEDDLAKYQSSAELKIVEVEFSVEELALRSQLERCMKTGCQRILERSAPLPTTDGDEENTEHDFAGIELLMKKMAGMASMSHLDVKAVDIITESIRNKKTSTSPTDEVEVIRRYLKVIGRSLLTLSAVGIGIALQDLDDLDDDLEDLCTKTLDDDDEDVDDIVDESYHRTASGNDRRSQFDTICRKLDLPGFGSIQQAVCRVRSLDNVTFEHMHTVISRTDGCQDGATGTEYSELERAPIYKQLVDELVLWWDSARSRDNVVAHNGRRIALVLVRERRTARSISSLLDRSNPLRRRRMRVAHLVGHGGGGKRGSDDKCAAVSGRDGMTVSRQSRVIKEIWNGEHNVVVATSVAEEGIDLPECDLVVRLDVPDCLRALVQVRGRARRRGGMFVVFCRENKEILERLLKQEENMMQAVELVV